MTKREGLARELARKCNYSLTDERLAVLVADATCDIEACPGSGKTTTLALKAAVELACQPDPASAVAILSHTNVARTEIERKAVAIPEARRVLHPPHFVGTIQAFVNHFLALPFLRSTGVEVLRIDNDAAGAFQARLLSQGRFSTARYALKNRGNWNVMDLEIDVAEGALTFDGDPLTISQDKPSYKQLADLKSESMAAGLFRFGDMYSFSIRYMNANPWVVEMLRDRFRIVLLDEAQDNDDRQSALLNALFPRQASPSRVHRFGDSNQSIFGDTFRTPSASNFPEAPMLPMSESMRFGPFIADVVSAVSANGQIVLGAGENVARPHTLFLYEETAVERVVPAFAELVMSTLDPEESVIAYAIGARRHPPAPASNGSLRAYLDSYFPIATKTVEPDVPDCFAKRVADARTNVPSRFATAANSVLHACAHLMKLYPVQDHTTAFRRLREDSMRRRSLGAVVLKLLCTAEINDVLWNAIVSELIAVFHPFFGEPSDAAKAFLAFWPCGSLELLGNNVSEFALEGEVSRRVAVQVKTIHAAKGETHRATLVLECFNRTHDLKKLVPYLCGAKRVTGKEEPADRQRLKTIYVALSRPEHLVCLALNAKHVTSSELEVLSKRWNIVHLTNPDIAA